MRKKVEPVMFHVATLPVVVELRRARRGSDTVVVLVKAGKVPQKRRRRK
jgi:hypothetical protein